MPMNVISALSIAIQLVKIERDKNQAVLDSFELDKQSYKHIKSKVHKNASALESLLDYQENLLYSISEQRIKNNSM
jgi:hypothetical protein